jgi:D-alanine-D-alanine ligase
MNIMAGFQGIRYSELLAQVLQAAVERLGVTAKPVQQPTSATGYGHAAAAA